MTPEPNRKRHAIKAPRERWLLLGELLEARRQELGYKYRPGFARDRLPPTDKGNPNARLVGDAERAYRPTFPPGTLREIARAYEVTYASLTAVLAGTAGELAPAAPAAPVAQLPPMTDAARVASARRWFDEINERRVALAARGITSPSGTQMFPDAPEDAGAWDGIGARMGIKDRVWLIAELRRDDAGRRGDAGSAPAGPQP